jgi:hypothetical protein
MNYEIESYVAVLEQAGVNNRGVTRFWAKLIRFGNVCTILSDEIKGAIPKIPNVL